MSVSKDEVKRILKYNKSDNLYDMIEQIFSSINSDLGELVAAKRDELENILIDTYFEIYTEEELRFMLNHYESPLGISIQEKSEELGREFAKAGEGFMMDLIGDFSAFTMFKNMPSGAIEN